MSAPAATTAALDAEIADLEGRLAEARARKMALLFAEAWDRVMRHLPAGGGAERLPHPSAYPDAPRAAPAKPQPARVIGPDGRLRYRCRRCGEPGHFAKTCAQRRAPAPAAAVEPDPEPEPARAPVEPDLVTRHVPLIEKVAGRMAKRLPAHVPFGDLLSAGAEGLMDAARRFDPTRGNTFAAFAEWRIKGAIIDDIRGRDSLSRDMRRWSNAIRDAERRLTAALGRAPAHEEVARELGLTPTELHARRLKLSGHTVVGLDDVDPDFLDWKVSDPAPSAFDGIARAQVRRYLDDAIRILPERERQVLSLYYRENLNLREVGEVMGFTESRACQVMAEAVAHLRELVDPDVVLDAN
jgi:RNA polymerase sigma factor FliA